MCSLGVKLQIGVSIFWPSSKELIFFPSHFYIKYTNTLSQQCWLDLFNYKNDLQIWGFCGKTAVEIKKPMLHFFIYIPIYLALEGKVASQHVGPSQVPGPPESQMAPSGEAETWGTARSGRGTQTTCLSWSCSIIRTVTMLAVNVYKKTTSLTMWNVMMHIPVKPDLHL